MTEAEWLTCTDTGSMLSLLEMGGDAPGSQRKARLLAVGLCRMAWPLLTDERSRHAVEIAERDADGLVGEKERGRAGIRSTAAVHRSRVRKGEAPGDAEVRRDVAHAASSTVTLRHAFDSARWVISFLTEPGRPPLIEPGGELAAIRCVFGNPFRPVAVDPRWRTSTVVALAQTIYADRAFDRLPILADALEDAGCGDAELLAHCRGEGPHVRGCWVVDLLLGKE